MATEVKKQVVAELVEKIKKSESIVLVDYKGLKVNEETELRKQMREAGAEYIVAKNRLFNIALKEAGVEDSFDDVLEGTTSFAFGYADAVAPAKVAYEFGKNKKVFNIKAGCLAGKRVDAAEVEALAKLPSREQLLSMVLNGMLGPIRKLAYGLVAIADKQEAAE
jgi:large subunit ribosomal protein L10